MTQDSAKIQRERDALLKLHEVNRAMSSEIQMGKLLNLIMENAITLTRAERGFLILKDGLTGKFDVQVARNIAKEAIEHPMFKVSRGIIDRAWDSSQPVIIESAQEDKEFGGRGSVINMKLASIACLPLKWRGQTFGVLYLDNRFRKGLFQADIMLILELFADEAAAAIAHARLLEELDVKKQELELVNAQLRAANTELHEEIDSKTTRIRHLEDEIRKSTESREKKS
jgi:GAF domain-containing protein